jgi:hypothetical protein
MMTGTWKLDWDLQAIADVDLRSMRAIQDFHLDLFLNVFSEVLVRIWALGSRPSSFEIYFGVPMSNRIGIYSTILTHILSVKPVGKPQKILFSNGNVTGVDKLLTQELATRIMITTILE